MARDRLLPCRAPLTFPNASVCADVEDEAAVASQTLSRDEALVRLSELFGEAAVKGLQDDQWKVRAGTLHRRCGHSLCVCRAQQRFLPVSEHVLLSVLCYFCCRGFCLNWMQWSWWRDNISYLPVADPVLLFVLRCIFATQSRLDTMEVVVGRVQEGSMGEHCSTLVQAMAHLPGWAEKNFQVRAGYCAPTEGRPWCSYEGPLCKLNFQ
eukprot:scaffold79348_cov34-Tisochrysis_lutea.AAC.1